MPTLKFVAAPKLPVPVPRTIDTLSEPQLAVARSGLPSPLKSPTTTGTGLVPTLKSDRPTLKFTGVQLGGGVIVGVNVCIAVSPEALKVVSIPPFPPAALER